MKLRKNGFVLAELLIVLAVIGILAAILLPALARAREVARRASCLSNLSQLGVAMRLYADEHDRFLPWSGGNDNAEALRVLHSHYLMNADVFVCPSDAGRGQLEDWFKAQRKQAQHEIMNPGERWDPGTGVDRGLQNLLDKELTTAFNDEISLRSSYDYLGAYSTAPLRLPHPSRPIPETPVMWDLVWDGSAGYTGPGGGEQRFNHVPGGSNVLYMDGSVRFVKFHEFAGPELPVLPQGVDFVQPFHPLDTEDYKFGYGR